MGISKVELISKNLALEVDNESLKILADAIFLRAMVKRKSGDLLARVCSTIARFELQMRGLEPTKANAK
jgi:hypothetical protein